MSREKASLCMTFKLRADNMKPFNSIILGETLPAKISVVNDQITQEPQNLPNCE
jgi:hypothetical protein